MDKKENKTSAEKLEELAQGNVLVLSGGFTEKELESLKKRWQKEIRKGGHIKTITN